MISSAEAGKTCENDNVCRETAEQSLAFIATAYASGAFAEQNNELAIKYYNEAQLLGGDYADELLALMPGLSEDKCKLLDKKSADDFKQLATCVDEELIEGHKAQFWIADFEYSKDIQSFLNAASRLVSGERNEELDANFANLLPVFHQLSTSSDVEALENALSTGPYNANDCIMKKDSLGFPIGGNVIFCVMAAEVPDAEALVPAAEFWKQGSELLQANPKYADVLLKRGKSSPDNCPYDDIFPELESSQKNT